MVKDDSILLASRLLTRSSVASTAPSLGTVVPSIVRGSYSGFAILACSSGMGCEVVVEAISLSMRDLCVLHAPAVLSSDGPRLMSTQSSLVLGDVGPALRTP